jgi:hypothetical protein
MKRSLLALAVASLVVAAAAGAKPVNNFGGCEYNTALNPGESYAQTFKPTFSVLKRARFVLFGDEASSEDTMFQLILRNQAGQFVAASDYATLAAGTSHDDAVSGDALTFTFSRGVRVTPGQTYQLELSRSSGTAPVRVCETFQSYNDGVFLWQTWPQMDWDLEFGVKGSGPGK